jgi:putative ABC transport system permease protein
MFQNYLKIAIRNLWKNKLFSFINITGLAIGVTCCILIFLYVQNELSYDKFHTKADRIYRVTSFIQQENKNDVFAPTSPMVATSIQQGFPEVQKIVRITNVGGPIAYKDKRFYEIKAWYVDSTFFETFTYPLVSGDPSKVLSAPYSMVVTESAAKKYFGNEDPVGKMLKFNDTLSLMVTAVAKDVPANSHFSFDAVVSRSTLLQSHKHIPDWIVNNDKSWFNCDSYVYILLKDHADAKAFEKKANAYLDKETVDDKKNLGMWMNVRIQPLADIHLHSHLEHEVPYTNNSDIKYVYIFSATALLILLIACCNFINLSTARSLNRSKEIGLRKVIGARRSQLIAQFLGESVTYTFIASLLSLIFLMFSIPLFNSFLGATLKLNMDVLWIFVIIIVTVGFLAGLYPSLLMSSFEPIRSLKGKVTHGTLDVIFRKGLVVFQFTIAIALIIGISVILKQLNYIQNRNLGLSKDQLLTISVKGQGRKVSTYVDEIKKNPQIVDATLNSFSFRGVADITLLPEGFAQNELTASPVIAVDENFLNTMQIKILEGRGFSKDFPTDATEAFMVNEAAVKEFRWKTPKNAIGKKVDWAFGKSGKVIGVVQNFNFNSLRENIRPMLIHIWPQWYGWVTVRVKTTDMIGTVKQLETTWKEVCGDAPFKHFFMREEFDALYRSEKNMRSVLTAFTILSVLVACLGLFGLAAFTIKQRFREIGIRKVLGSSVSGIVKLLSKDFLKLVAVSIVIAVPAGWYFMNKWLEDFAYRTEIGAGVFIIAGVAALLIAFATVALQAAKAALSNPVKSIRTE